MKAEERRELIYRELAAAGGAVTAGALSLRCGVSRQVIVQDIAVLRAAGRDIISTSRGYVLNTPKARRVFKCRHGVDGIVEECSLIVEAGGRVEDVFVNHRVYGTISSPLALSTKTHVEELYRSLAAGASKPLMSVTDGYHYHTVSAESEDLLDKIEEILRGRGFLVEE